MGLSLLHRRPDSGLGNIRSSPGAPSRNIDWTLLIGQGLLPLALPMLDDMVARAPGWAEAWNKRATALYLAGEHDRSLSDIDRVLALEPRHFGALAGMGLIRIAKGQYREALDAFRRALAVNPFLKERVELIPALERMVGEKPI